MLGLPSTTEIAKGGRIPKEAFYRNLALSAKVKESFVADVEGFHMANTVKGSTANLLEGADTKEIAVLRVGLKSDGIDSAVLDEIAKANPRKDRLRLRATRRHDKAFRKVGGKIVSTPGWKPEGEWQLRLEAQLGRSLGSHSVADRLRRYRLRIDERCGKAGAPSKVESLRAKIEATDRKCRKEKQLARKNRLFAEVKGLKEELRALEQEG